MEIVAEEQPLQEALRPHLPVVAAEVTVRMRRDFPALGRDGHLDLFVEELVGHFVGLLDPLAPSSDPSAVLLRHASTAGAREAAQGRSLDVLPAAVRSGAGIALARLTERAEQLGLRLEMSAVGRLAQRVFASADRIADAVLAGHGGRERSSLGEPERRRRELLALLLNSNPQPAELKSAAENAGWPLPRSVAVLVVPQGETVDARRALPPDALPGLHREQPCLLLPDPDGPGRRRRWESGLAGRLAAVGPTVEVTEAASSLWWAERTLELMTSGALASHDERPVRAADHLALLMTSWGADLTERVAAERLAPLDEVRPSPRQDLEVTLLTLLECRFRATTAAARLHVHPQTVRYRLRKLQELFGEELYAPHNQLELHLLLYARTNGRSLPAPG